MTSYVEGLLMQGVPLGPRVHYWMAVGVLGFVGGVWRPGKGSGERWFLTFLGVQIFLLRGDSTTPTA